ncbi:MAG TPA: SDR family oxidoreductase [Vicinamibacterales bacterium]|jgi:short-subunit dehydrogenase
MSAVLGNGGRFSWSGRRALITGGSSGIGKQLASDLLRRGAHVGIVAQHADKLKAAELDLRQISPNVWSYACDIALLDEVRAMARAYRERFDAPEVLINNAGYAVYYTFEQMPSEEIHRLFDVNLVGASLVTREFLPDMIRAGGGRVVMMASIAGRIPMTPCGVYSASKHGLVALAELLRVETARFRIKVHVVCPGRVETEFFSHQSFKARAHRPETSRTIPVEVVSEAVIAAIEHNRFMTSVPRHLGVLAWMAAAMPIVFRPFWHRFLSARVESVYTGAAVSKVE